MLTSDQIFAIILVGLVVVICMTTLLHSMLEAHYDKKFPERLKRFENDRYEQGVKDCATKIE